MSTQCILVVDDHEPLLQASRGILEDEGYTVFTAADAQRLGVGRGRRPVSRVLEWLRKSDQKVALVTNGSQWRLIHAGADYDAWCEWDTELWFEEGVPGPQITALRVLLGPADLMGDDFHFFGRCCCRRDDLLLFGIHQCRFY